MKAFWYPYRTKSRKCYVKVRTSLTERFATFKCGHAHYMDDMSQPTL